MADIKFRIAAKTDVGCVRTNNEDNFQAAADLASGSMSWVNNQLCDLGDLGALLVVADGMGGMNAGEVASAIAIDTVRKYFTPERITPEVLKSRFTIEKFMKDVVVEADRTIKSTSNSTTRGMGTTIVMAWLLRGQCYICWCGDSRAYIYNKASGLQQVSKDHSYVQTLVDAGEITPEQAFDFPGSNVITRCLCDAKQVAVPDCLVMPQPLCQGDLILLCSDGLSGLLRDHEMQAIIEQYPEDVNAMADALIDAALGAGGTDNVTVAIARIEEGGAEAPATRVVPSAPKPAVTPTPVAAATADVPAASAHPMPTNAPAKPTPAQKAPAAKKSNSMTIVIAILVAAIVAVAAYCFIGNNSDTTKDKETGIEKYDDDDSDEPDSDEDYDEADGHAVTPGTARPRRHAAPGRPATAGSATSHGTKSVTGSEGNEGSESGDATDGGSTPFNAPATAIAGDPEPASTSTPTVSLRPTSVLGSGNPAPQTQPAEETKPAETPAQSGKIEQ